MGSCALIGVGLLETGDGSVLLNKIRRSAGLVGMTIALGLSSIGFANPVGPDQAIEDARPVDTGAGRDTRSTVAVVSDAVNNVVAIYLSDFGLNGSNILARNYPLGEAAGAEARLQTLCSNCGGGTVAAAGQANGNFVLVWVGDDDAGGAALYAQFYDSRLAPIGNRMVLDPNGSGSVKVDMNSSGEFAVLHGTGNGSTRADVVQRYDANGAAVGAPQQVAGFGDVAIAESGAFATVYLTAPLAEQPVKLERFAADGKSLGIVDVTGADYFEDQPIIEIAGDGTILVLWQPHFDMVVGQLLSTAGAALGDPFTIFTALQSSYEVAASDDEFVVGLEGDDDMFVRRVGSDGTLSALVEVYSRDEIDNPDPDLVRDSSDADGDFASLVSEDGTNEESSVFLRRFAGSENVDLAARITTNSSAVAQGSTIAFDVLVDNNHDPVAPLLSTLPGAEIFNRAIGSATGLTVTARLPAGVSNVTVSGTTAPSDRKLRCSQPERGTVRCTLNGPLYAGESVSARLMAIAPNRNAALQATVQASADQFDSNEGDGNNTDSVSVVVGDVDTSAGDSDSDGDDSDSGGGGCTMTDADVPFDPLFLVLCVAAALMLLRRRRASNVL